MSSLLLGLLGGEKERQWPESIAWLSLAVWLSRILENLPPLQVKQDRSSWCFYRSSPGSQRYVQALRPKSESCN